MSNPFSKLFGQSPIVPIQEHIELAHECAEQLWPLVQALKVGDLALAKQIHQKMLELEQAADAAKAKLRANLPSTLMMPFDRNDLLTLISTQDQIANISKDVAGIMLGRKMQIPDQIVDSVQQFLKVAIDTSAQAVKVVNEMDELLELGFKGRVIEIVNSMVSELNRLEHENDELQIKVRAQLFGIEQDLPPIDAMFLYKVIDLIGDLADAAQSAGVRLQLLIAR